MYHLLFRKITTDTNVLGVMTNINTDIQYDCISILISQTVLIFNDCICKPKSTVCVESTSMATQHENGLIFYPYHVSYFPVYNYSSITSPTI